MNVHIYGSVPKQAQSLAIILIAISFIRSGSAGFSVHYIVGQGPQPLVIGTSIGQPVTIKFGRLTFSLILSVLLFLYATCQ